MGVPFLPDGQVLPDGLNWTGFDGDDPLDNLAVLYQAQVAMIEDAKKSGGTPAFRLGLFFADVLDCFGLLTLDNLTRVMGYKNASKVWEEVKPVGRADNKDCVQ